MNTRIYHEIIPRKGQVYTIRGFEVRDKGVAVHLEEIVNNEHQYREGFLEASFYAWRFKPVKKSTTDISSLEALLNPANHKKLVGV